MDGQVKKAFLGLNDKLLNLLLKICAAAAAVCALALTFTIGDYYIFNRWVTDFNFFFCLSQWVKKAGLLMIVLAVFFGCRSCADAVKYVLPLFIILSCFLTGGFFDVMPQIAEGDTNAEIFRNLNLFFPKWLNITLFYLENVLLAACCALFILRDGVKPSGKSYISLPLALGAAMPLNIFENFFDINKVPENSFLRFYNFTFWHFVAILCLIGVTVGLYAFLKNKDRATQDKWLAAVAVCLLLQYHSKDSVLLGDGYNVYNTIWAVLPLFICNIGVYVASASVILKKKPLYSISFFVHAVGALTVFVYFGKREMSNYGIFCSYSILYFCLTHCLLFALCVIPSALGHYKFKIRDCIVPLVYYFIVILIACIASTLVSYASTLWTAADGTHLLYDGVYVQGYFGDKPVIGEAGFMKPNYAFTQTNPLPFDVPNLIPLGGAFAYINLFYVILVYIAYVCLFFTFYGAYRVYLIAYGAAHSAILKKRAQKAGAYTGDANAEAGKELAATDGETGEELATADGETAVTQLEESEQSEEENIE